MNSEIILLHRKLKKYRTELTRCRRSIGIIEEWLLHKFGFDVNLRIQMSKNASKNVNSDSEDDEEEEEDEIVEIGRVQLQRDVQMSRIVNHNQNLKRKRAYSNSEDVNSQAKTTTSESTQDNVNKNTSQTKATNSSFKKPDDIHNAAVPCVMEIEEESICENSQDISKTLTTKTGVQIVHEDDENVDIKFNLFTQLDLIGGGSSHTQTNEGITVSRDVPSIENTPEGSRTTTLPLSTNVIEISPFEKLIQKISYSPTFFHFQWIAQMKKFQVGIMPYSMFIKRDDLRVWFEYLYSKSDPSSSRYRCRLCHKYVREWGYPRKYWGPMEAHEGQLKKKENDNRNTINLHASKQSHKEIFQRLSSSESEDLGPQINLSKIVRRQLLDSLETG